MRSNVNRKVYNDRENVSATAYLSVPLLQSCWTAGRAGGPAACSALAASGSSGAWVSTSTTTTSSGASRSRPTTALASGSYS